MSVRTLDSQRKCHWLTFGKKKECAQVERRWEGQFPWVSEAGLGISVQVIFSKQWCIQTNFSWPTQFSPSASSKHCFFENKWQITVPFACVHTTGQSYWRWEFSVCPLHNPFVSQTQRRNIQRCFWPHKHTCTTFGHIHEATRIVTKCSVKFKDRVCFKIQAVYILLCERDHSGLHRDVLKIKIFSLLRLFVLKSLTSKRKHQEAKSRSRRFCERFSLWFWYLRGQVWWWRYDQ